MRSGSVWLKRTGGKIFHATDAEFENNHNLIEDLSNIIVRTKLEGWGVGIDLKSYRYFFPDKLDDKEPYLKCFEKVVRHFAKKAFEIKQKVKFTFHINQKIQYNATYLYNCMVNQPDYEYSKYLFGELGFADNSIISIQVACFFAREIMKHIDNFIGPVERPTRKSMQSLLETGRFECNIIEDRYWQGLIMDIISPKSNLNINYDNYREWLNRHRLSSDNLSNQLWYIFETMEKEKSK